ncbi:MAG: helix-turn-helix domain-containing protein [Acidimicrobiales bacterium]|jgi:AcrR family transcriptional regulator|nr:helix-turn-helix transcriptional regulator [Actinomycetes bacterium]MDG1989571.1 helix-turn-helix domain containing protein [Acidimicrobiales bacterium]MDP6159938.1 helix-turn-helix domain-containing protein [Acidimicrobiales bacterium]MDP6911404.1 helix-turn-helix domain-containing protein [Acidimicrobiales bacterium]HJM73981.1 helix-turn-helix domain-containing protein [Acidimicrobiales bacterium]|tara:strand:+ start:3476 stop:4051 length:576 start_codon:yes stop_codon:yes gene_type:complete
MGVDPDGEPSSRTALLDAAIRLMSERPPSTVTGRALAEEAEVNYGLVHYYFESSGDLLRAARGRHGSRLLADSMAGGTRPIPLNQVVSDREIFGFAAHVALEGGYDDEDVSHPVFDAMLGMATEGDQDGDPVHHRATVAAIVLLQLGWPVFVEHNATGLGLDLEADGEVIRDRFFTVLESLYRSIGVEVER